jgi:alkylation response protein AidB-like acyl-CoA dehydrogenase
MCKAAMGKCFANEMAVEVTSAMQVFGGYGCSREFPWADAQGHGLESRRRDIRCSDHHGSISSAAGDQRGAGRGGNLARLYLTQ